MPNKLERPCKWCRQVHSTVGRYCSLKCASAAVEAAANPLNCRCCGRTFIRTARRRCLCYWCFASDGRKPNFEAVSFDTTCISVAVSVRYNPRRCARVR